MSKIINNLKWRNGREICRLVCNELGESGMSVVNWVDMSEEDIDPREDRRFNYQLLFTMVRMQRNGKFVNVVQMTGLPQDGRFGTICDCCCLPEDDEEAKYAVSEEGIASLLHNVVDDDSEPQYCLGVDLAELGALDGGGKDDGKDDEPGWFVSEGGSDTPVIWYDRTEWPFKEERRSEGEGESRSDWNKNASILRIKDMLESMPENAVLGVERVVEVMHG